MLIYFFMLYGVSIFYLELPTRIIINIILRSVNYAHVRHIPYYNYIQHTLHWKQSLTFIKPKISLKF